jgi:hypothetical protein
MKVKCDEAEELSIVVGYESYVTWRKHISNVLPGLGEGVIIPSLASPLVL